MSTKLICFHRLPFLFMLFITLVLFQGYQLNDKLDEKDKVELNAFIALVNNKLLQAEVHPIIFPFEIFNPEKRKFLKEN